MSAAQRMICILGPTASGKTRLAAVLAHRIDGEVMSCDSRQVFRHMDLGTGKDLSDYTVCGKKIPYHLIDIVDPGTPFSVFDYQKAFSQCFPAIVARGATPILCGGSGLYLEAVLMDYALAPVERNHALRRKLSALDHAQLVARLAALRPLHNTTDTMDRERLMRAIEISEYQRRNPEKRLVLPSFTPRVFGLRWPRDMLKQKIEVRLRQRLEAGLLAEVETLLQDGLARETLQSYGLEYRFVTAHLSGALNRNDMFQKLRGAIWRFAKRQETWFRRMERRGLHITWLDGRRAAEHNAQAICAALNP